jgi:SAM-dependent methyltransferase
MRHLGIGVAELLGQWFRSTRQSYDWIAGRFEQTPFRTSEWIFQKAVPEIGRVGAVEAALDLGCGTGAASRAIRHLCHSVLVGVDLSGGMLREARQRWPMDGQGPRLLLCQGDALAIPAGQRFDLVVSFGMFMHIEPRRLPRMVAEVARVLRPGGRFAFVTAHPPGRWSYHYWIARAFNAAMRIRNWLHSPPMNLYYLGFSVNEAARMLREAGFDVKVPEGVFPGPRLRLVIGTRR